MFLAAKSKLVELIGSKTFIYAMRAAYTQTPWQLHQNYKVSDKLAD